MQNIQQVTESILNDINSLRDISTLDGSTLSVIALRLSVNKVYVGQQVAEMDYELSQQTLAKKLEWARVFAGIRNGTQKMTVDDAKSATEALTEELTREENEKKREVDILKNLRRDVSEVITTIQTRIGQLKSEYIEVNGIGGK